MSLFYLGHKTIGVYFTSAFLTVFFQQLKIIFFIFIIKKYSLSIIASLYYMMRIFFNYYSRNSWHARIIPNLLSQRYNKWDVSLFLRHYVYLVFLYIVFSPELIKIDTTGPDNQITAAFYDLFLAVIRYGFKVDAHPPAAGFI